MERVAGSARARSCDPDRRRSGTACDRGRRTDLVHHLVPDLDMRTALLKALGRGFDEGLDLRRRPMSEGRSARSLAPLHIAPGSICCALKTGPRGRRRCRSAGQVSSAGHEVQSNARSVTTKSQMLMLRRRSRVPLRHGRRFCLPRALCESTRSLDTLKPRNFPESQPEPGQ